MLLTDVLFSRHGHRLTRSLQQLIFPTVAERRKAARATSELSDWTRVRRAELEAEAARYASGSHLTELLLPDGKRLRFSDRPTVLFFADPQTPSGIADLLLMHTYAAHFGNALRTVWVAESREAAEPFAQNHRDLEIEFTIDPDGSLYRELSGRSLIVAADGRIEQAFLSPTKRETRLFLNKLLPDQPFVWEERSLEEAMSVRELGLYSTTGTPITDFTGTVVFLSPYCPGCSEWLEDGHLNEIEEPVQLVFPASQYELGIEKYENYWDGRDTVTVALQLGVSPYRVRFPSTIRLAADG